MESIPAGKFSEWLRATEASLQSGTVGAEVLCGTCRGCCRSSMFIQIAPAEKQTLRHIPRALLVPAPGLPRGYRLMGYDDQGRCPMLVEGDCSIYADRPQTCRDYDCRIFAATGIEVDAQSQPEIAERVRVWKFDYETADSRMEHQQLRATADFLRSRPDVFPSHPIALALLAIRVFRLHDENSPDEILRMAKLPPRFQGGLSSSR